MVFHLLLAPIFPNEVVFLALTRCLLVNWLAVWWTEPKVTLPLVMISWSIPCCLHSSCRDLTLVRLPREGQEFTFHPDLIGVFLPGLILLWAETCLGPETGETTCQPRVYQNLKCFLYWSLSLFPSCKSLNSFFFFPLSCPWSCFWRRKQAPSWKQDSMLGQIVDFELYAQYLWKQHTNWKTRPPGRDPGLNLDSVA